MEFTKIELKLIKSALECLDCSACIFQYDCDDDQSAGYGPCDYVKQKLEKEGY
jgi:hypothetical protein